MCLASLILGGTLPLALSAQPAPVQQVLGQCIYPSRPLLDEASLHALGLTMGEELSRYMNDAQAYTQWALLQNSAAGGFTPPIW